MEATARIPEPRQEVRAEQMELTDRQKLSILNYRRYGGIDIEVLDRNHVKITHARFTNGILLNQKDLYDRARKIFPDSEVKIIPVVNCMRPSEISREWILGKMDELGIKRNDLVKQLGLDKAYLSLLLSEKQGGRKVNFSRAMKATFYYYFLSYEISREFKEYIDHVQQIPDEYK